MKHLLGRGCQRLKCPLGEGQKTKLERRAARRLDGKEEWGDKGEESGCEWDCQEAEAGHEVGLRAAVEPCQRGSRLACAAGTGWAGAARSVRGCGCVVAGEPGQARARQGRRGRVAAATSRRMIILWSPQKSKVMCVC